MVLLTRIISIINLTHFIRRIIKNYKGIESKEPGRYPGKSGDKEITLKMGSSLNTVQMSFL